MKPLLISTIVVVCIAAAVWVLFVTLDTYVGNYNRTFSAACVARGGVPTRLSREWICTAPGVMK